MQRKNNILKSSRSGIAMIMAIAVIVIIGTIMALSLSLTTQTSKRTVDLYLYEQAILYSKAATEYALLKIAQDGNCSHQDGITLTQDDIYKADISIQYIYTAGVCGTQYATVVSPEQNGSVLLDVSITVDDNSITSEPIRYFRRTIQKL